MDRLDSFALNVGSAMVLAAVRRPASNVEAQIRILRSRIKVGHSTPTPQEEAGLLQLGALLGRDQTEGMHVALQF